MFSIFRKNKLDLSSPTNFEESIIKASDNLEDLFGPKTWQEIAKKRNPRAYMEIIESLALSGNSKCQDLVSQWSTMICVRSDNPETLKFGLRKAIQFGQLAAQSGIARECLNLPISMMKLADILVEESGGSFTDEIEELFKGTYRWSVFNSKNLQLSKEDRESAAELATELYEGLPELFDSEPDVQEEKKQSEPVLHGQRCAKEICDAVNDYDVIFQLVLEDIEGASMGNEDAKAFARLSGISPSQYAGSLNNSRPEVDGPNGVKTYLDEMALRYYPDLEKVVEFRLAATDYIMRHHKIGKYAAKA